MKKVYGIFRGFPGLGRVSAGVAILRELRERGYEVAAISYYQGVDVLRNNGIPLLFDYELEDRDYTSIGINPITGFATRLVEKVLVDQPDAIIIDGEPFLQSVLCDVYSPERIFSLLNPSDMNNDSLPNFIMKFYHKYYLSCKNAIVHGINIQEKIDYINGCKVHFIPTILRDEVLDICVNNKDSKRIVGILGGGSKKASESFSSSTIDMGVKISSIATMMSQYNFDIYCNDEYICKEIVKKVPKIKNLKIISQYTSPSEIYKDAKLAIVRAGRNVASELLYLQIPGLLIATNGDYRSHEQEKNIDMMVNCSENLFGKIALTDSDIAIRKKVEKMLDLDVDFDNRFVPGNDYVIKIIDNAIGGNGE